LNRSLPGLSAQVCHLQFFQSRSIFLTGRRSVTCPFFCRAALFFCRAAFLCPVASPLPCQRASNFFFSDRSFTLLGAPFFLFVCVSGAPLFPFPLCSQASGHFPLRRAQGSFFLHADAPLSGHFPLRRAQGSFFCMQTPLP
jgi:hypothetical protein